MAGFLSFALLSAVSLNLAYAAPADIADPTITSPATLPADYIGLFENGGEWWTYTCADLTYHRDGQYADCCDTKSQCAMQTGCTNGGTVLYSYLGETSTDSFVCNSGLSCQTHFLYSDRYDVKPISLVDCDTTRLNVYRTIDFTETVSSSEDITSSPSSIPSPTNSESSSSSSGTKEIVPAESGSNAGLIAGAIIGPIVGLALGGLGVFFLLRRRRNRKPSTIPPSDPSMAPAGVTSFSDDKPVRSPPPNYQAANIYPEQGGFAPESGPLISPYISPASPQQHHMSTELDTGVPVTPSQRNDAGS